MDFAWNAIKTASWPTISFTLRNIVLPMMSKATYNYVLPALGKGLGYFIAIPVILLIAPIIVLHDLVWVRSASKIMPFITRLYEKLVQSRPRSKVLMTVDERTEQTLGALLQNPAIEPLVMTQKPELYLLYVAEDKAIDGRIVPLCLIDEPQIFARNPALHFLINLTRLIKSIKSSNVSLAFLSRQMPQIPSGNVPIDDPLVVQRREVIVGAIMEAVEMVKPDLVVSGSRVGVMGPVTEQLARQCPCPLVLVKTHMS